MAEFLPKIPGYYIDSILSNEGGTGVVYQGIDLRSGYGVAIKQLYASRANNPAIVQAFRQEANNYLYIKHPGVTRLVDFVEYNGTCFLIMELLHGQTLDHFQRTRTGPMPDEMLVPMFMQILEVIDYLHHVSTPFATQGMLHLDIKPSNIMVCDKLQIKVMDMGISAVLSEHLTQNRVCGTPAYMPPEQVHHGQLGPYTDVFALGVTLYFMLTMRLPFEASSNQQIWDKIVLHQYPPTSTYYPYVNRAFDSIIDRALQPDYHFRYQSCSDMAIDIRRVLSKV